MTRKWRRNPLRTLKTDSLSLPLLAKGRDEQATDFGRRVWPPRKLERRAVAEIAHIDVGVGARGADHAPSPILGESEVATLDGQGLEACRRPRRRRELG